MYELIKPAIELLKSKIGISGLLAIAFFAIGILFTTSYGNYVVTPEELNSEKISIFNKVAFVELRIIKVEKSLLFSQQYDLEDIIFEYQSSGNPIKPRLQNRLLVVKSRLNELEDEEALLLKTLETSK